MIGGILGAPAVDRATQPGERANRERHRKPHRDRPVRQDCRKRDRRRHAECDQHAGDPAAHRSGERQRVRHLPDEVGEDDHGDGRRVAERMKHRPQHGRVERPIGRRAGQPCVPRADERDRVAHGAADQRRLPGAGAEREAERKRDRERGRQGGDRTQRDWAVVVHESDRQWRAGEHDGEQEHRIQDDEERQQRAGRARRGQAGPPQRPHGQRRSAGSGGRQ